MVTKIILGILLAIPALSVFAIVASLATFSLE